ncbi:MAG: hypothetical protein LBI45_05120, partial [Bacteroidales bacterium]|nr:hypothetical protein [Bacteroidales bacterium]
MTKGEGFYQGSNFSLEPLFHIESAVIKDDEMKADEILSQYHGLWQVEESFRISKHDLRIRPVFH